MIRFGYRRGKNCEGLITSVTFGRVQGIGIFGLARDADGRVRRLRELGIRWTGESPVATWSE